MSGYSDAARAVTVGALLLAGCATSVEYAPPPEEAIVRADGAPYRGVIERFAVSRDGQVIVFHARSGDLGLPDGVSGLFVYDRRTGVARAACGVSGDSHWELSEDGRYLMKSVRRYDLATCEVVELDRFGVGFDFSAIVYFKDGSGVAFQDDDIPGVRVSYYDGRPDVVIPMALPGLDLEDPVAMRARLVLSSDRWGHRLLVSGYYWGPALSDRDGLEIEHWVVSVADGTMRRIADDLTFRAINLPTEIRVALLDGLHHGLHPANVLENVFIDSQCHVPPTVFRAPNCSGAKRPTQVRGGGVNPRAVTAERKATNQWSRCLLC